MARLTDEERARRAQMERAVAFLRKMITESNEWACAALMRVYDAQTTDEQVTGETREHNGIGFTGFDAPILSSFAENYLRWRNTPKSERRFSTPFSPKQAACMRRMMGKYARQCMTLEVVRTAVFAVMPAE